VYTNVKRTPVCPQLWLSLGSDFSRANCALAKNESCESVFFCFELSFTTAFPLLTLDLFRTTFAGTDLRACALGISLTVHLQVLTFIDQLIGFIELLLLLLLLWYFSQTQLPNSFRGICG
jgi:hypothetical protein